MYHELGVAVFYNGINVGRIPRKRRYDTEKCMTWGISSEIGSDIIRCMLPLSKVEGSEMRFYMTKGGDYVDRVSKKR